MKVKVQGKQGNGTFEPYQVIFEIQTEEDSTRFHDEAAISINADAGDFIAHIYDRCDGLTNADFEGEI